MTRLTDEQNARIAALQDYLEKRARYLHYTHLPAIPVGDLVQEANLAILERAAKDSDFLNQTDSYVTTHGLWRAQDAARRTLRYEPDAILDDDETGLADALAAPESDLDLSVAVRQALAEAELDSTTRTIAEMLAQSYRKTDIANHLGIKKQSVSYHVQKIQHALAGVAA